MFEIIETYRNYICVRSHPYCLKFMRSLVSDGSLTLVGRLIMSKNQDGTGDKLVGCTLPALQNPTDCRNLS